MLRRFVYPRNSSAEQLSKAALWATERLSISATRGRHHSTRCLTGRLHAAAQQEAGPEPEPAAGANSSAEQLSKAALWLTGRLSISATRSRHHGVKCLTAEKPSP